MIHLAVVMALAPAALAALAAGEHDPLTVGVARGLPSRQHALAQLEWAANYEKETGKSIPFDIDFGVWCWRVVADIQHPDTTPHQKGMLLQELIDWLGWEAVLTARIPPPVPLYMIPERAP